MNDERIFYELSRGNGYSKMRCSDERVDIFFSSFFMMERLGRASYSEYVLWFCPSVNSPPGQENIRRGLLCMYQSDMYVKIWSVNQNQNWNFEEKIQFGLPFAT